VGHVSDGNIELDKNTMKSKTYHTVGTVPKLNRILVETEAKPLNTCYYIYDCSLSCIGTGIAMNSGVVK
jgi:hypothetical protein